MTVYNSESQKTFETYDDDSAFFHLIDQDDFDEEELWAEFEAQSEGDWDGLCEDDAYSFAEDGADEVLAIPPKSGQLIDHFSTLVAPQREHLLDMVKLLIDQELGKR